MANQRAEQENGTGRLATCPACVEKRIHTDEEWEKHSLLHRDEPEEAKEASA